MKLPISVCILVKNEADRLPKTLPKLGDFAEVIVLDTGSEDDSIAIAEQYGASVHTAEWEGFAGSRRRLFNLAQQPWIFWLDADEVFTDELLADLKVLFTKEPQEAAFWVNRIVYFEGKWIRHGDWFPDWNIRLFRKEAWTMPERAVHESLAIEGEVGRLHSLLEHYTYRDLDDQRRRCERYAKLWAAQHKDRTYYPMQPAMRGAWRFLRGYLLKRGFRDGKAGLRIALANARETRLKYRLLRKQ